MGSFIDALQISEPDKIRLKQLGADTPFSLLSLIRAAPHEFDALMGENASLVRGQVEALTPSSQRDLPRHEAEFALGAELGPHPRLPTPVRDIATRDRLFSEWQSLRNGPATRNSVRARELEKELNAMLEG